MVRLQAAKEPVTRAKRCSRSQVTTVTSEWPCSGKFRQWTMGLREASSWVSWYLRKPWTIAMCSRMSSSDIDLEIGGRQVVEMGDDLGGIELAVEIFEEPLLDLHARLFRHRAEFLDAAERARGAMVELPEQQVLPVGIAAPGTGAERIGEGEEHEQVEPFLGLHDAGEFDDRVLIVEVLAPRDLGHGEMVIDQKDQRGKIGAFQPHPARHAHRVDRAGFRMALGVFRFAGVVEEHRQIEDVGPRHLLQDGAVLREGRLGGVDDFVEHLDANERVFVGGVTMKKFVLHQAGQGRNSGKKRPSKPSSCMLRKARLHLSLAR